MGPQHKERRRKKCGGETDEESASRMNVLTGRLRYFEPYRVVIRDSAVAEKFERLVLVTTNVARTIVVPHPCFGLVGERLKGLHDVDEAVHVKHAGLAIHCVPQRFA